MATSPNFSEGQWQIISTEDHLGGPEHDILWRNVLNGAQLLWQMNGSEVLSATALPSLGPTYTADVIGDFDGDGKADVWLRSTVNGTNQILLSSTGTIALQSGLGLEWQASASTELDGNGFDDMLWFNTATQTLATWSMSGTSIIGSAALASGYAGNDKLLSAFNGSTVNTFDSLWFDDSTNAYNITSYDAGVRTITEVFSVSTGGSYFNTSDYDGDGDATDFLFLDQGGAGFGDAELVFSNGVDEVSRIVWDASILDGAQIVSGGDVDGDGIAELLARDPVSGDLTLMNAIGGTVLNQTLYGSASPDLIDGRSGADEIHGFGGHDILVGGAGNDMLEGGSGDDRIDGGDQDDLISGGLGDDLLQGGEDDDALYGGPGADILRAGNGTDYLDGGADDDFLVGGPTSSGFDHLTGGAGNDVLVAGEAPVIVDGGAGDDVLIASDGNDYLRGGIGNDILVGGFNRDTLDGGSGDDILIGSDRGGSSGVTDTMIGSSGFDYFYLGNDSQAFYTISGQGIIKDFSSFSDKVVLTGFSSDYSFNPSGGDVQILFGPSSILIGTVENATPAAVQDNAIFMA